MPKNYNLFLKGYVGAWDFSADMVNAVLDKNKDKEVHVLIDSTGGELYTALSISSLFKIHGNVHCHYVGANASAATVAAMGAKHVSIDAHAVFLVHKCMSVVFEWDYMNADELAEHIADLEKLKKDNDTFDGCIAGMYASRCKKPKEDLLALMKRAHGLRPGRPSNGALSTKSPMIPRMQPPCSTMSLPTLLPKREYLCRRSMSKGSFIERLVQFFTSSSSKPAAEAVEPEAAQSSPQMSKPLTAIAALLGASVAVADGKLTLTAEQADSLEAALAGHDAKVNDLNAKITEKDGKINELSTPKSPTS